MLCLCGGLQSLQKAIGRRIEEELVTIAANKGNNFKVLKTGEPKSSSKKKGIQ